MQQLANLGKRTSRTDPEFIKETYACAPNRIRCVVAEDDDGTVLGLQVLKVAADGNPLNVAPGWGIIGTHIRPDAARCSIRRALFIQTSKAAEDAELTKIGAHSAAGLTYSDEIGFKTYRTPD